jgi:hypothetical protein
VRSPAARLVALLAGADVLLFFLLRAGMTGKSPTRIIPVYAGYRIMQ